MQEIWKPVPVEGFGDIYHVSNFGRIKRVRNRYVRQKNRVLKPLRGKNGYSIVMLWDYPKRKTVLIHRMVGMAFIPNPKKLPYINHKDHGRTNNHVDNLEWCNQSYNVSYRFKHFKHKPFSEEHLANLSVAHKQAWAEGRYANRKSRHSSSNS